MKQLHFGDDDDDQGGNEQLHHIHCGELEKLRPRVGCHGEKMVRLLEIYSASGAEAFIGCGNNAHGLDGIVHVVAEVEVFADGAEEILLFAQA